MFTRRQFLERTLKSSSLVALSSLVPDFIANTARATPNGKDNILVVLEMNGGNDGLNTVIPFADDLYHTNRPTLRYKKEEVVRVNDQLGLNPSLRPFEQLLQKGQLAIVQGVGYPNPDRSHFESMDIWQSADPKRRDRSGWLGRGMNTLKVQEGHIPGIFVGKDKLPLALEGSATGTPAIDPNKPYELRLESGESVQVPPQGTTALKDVATVDAKAESPKAAAPDPHREERLQLIRELAEIAPINSGDLLPFVRRSALQTYTAVESLRRLMKEDMPDNPQPPQPPQFRQGGGDLQSQLNLIAKMIRAGFGTRIFYVSMGSFDTHSNQRRDHENLLQQLATGVSSFLTQLEQSGDAGRVVLLTYSEFGRRVKENGSKGTDHGAASCLFLAGQAVQSGPTGKHPSLAKADLDDGDLKYHTDFRQVYATLLDRWLECDSQKVLNGKFAELALFKKK